MNITQTNNISFKNTFYLYPNKKNAKQVTQKIEKISSQYGVSWVEINPKYDKKGRPLEIDGRKTTSKEVISINRNSSLDQNVRSFCIKNNIDFIEYTNRSLAEKIIQSAQIANGNSGKLDSYIAVIDAEALEGFFENKYIDSNFNELKEEYNEKKQSTKNAIKAYLKSGEKFKAPCLEDNIFEVNLSQNESSIPSGSFALNGYSCQEIKYSQRFL